MNTIRKGKKRPETPQQGDEGSKRSEKSANALRVHRQKQSHDTQEKYYEDPNICPNCGELVAYEKRSNRFCNQSCAASFNNRGVLRVKKNERKSCANCGALVTKRNKYCDACIAQGVHINRTEDLAEAKWDSIRKRIILGMRGHKCESCGLSEWLEQKIPLELDHVDGNSDNNSENNLRLLCPNCHALTETYKGANAGKDSSRQKMRRKRYSEGKTY